MVLEISWYVLIKDLSIRSVLSNSCRVCFRSQSPVKVGGRRRSPSNGDKIEELHQITDAYGFTYTITQTQAAALQQCAEQEEKQRERWAHWQPSGPLPPPEKLKKLCRNGIPPEIRPWVWMEISGASKRKSSHHASYYSAMSRLGRHESAYAHQIELDIPRTFPMNSWLQEEQGQAALRRILLAFAQHNPVVGYCQGMNYLAALLLLALNKNEDSAFWVLASLIDDEAGILYQGMYARDLTGTHVEMRSLREFVDIKLPRLGAHLDALRCDMSLLATDWFLCLFSTAVPAETVARIWDSLLHEGPKVLFRVALALLKIVEHKLLLQDNPGEILRAARSCASEQFDRDGLMRLAFEHIGSLPMGAIWRYRAANQRDVDSEFAERETRANLRAAVKEGFVLTEDLKGMLTNTGVQEEEGSSTQKKTAVFQFKTVREGFKDALDRSKLSLDKSKNTVISSMAHRRTKSVI